MARRDTRPAERPCRSTPAATTSFGTFAAVPATLLSINEPKRNPKGKKPTTPDSDSAGGATPSKKHQSPHSLRTRSSLPNISKSSTTMTRKNKATRKSTSSKRSRTDQDVVDFGAGTRPEGDDNLAESSRKETNPERHESDEDDDEEDSDDDDED
ncbi:hypothetical protein FRC09_000264 [Ceratobasidium sp. 395]|nr:hypothetical protein FRC09_000264 [Ceratobasidium sp. 395]